MRRGKVAQKRCKNGGRIILKKQQHIINGRISVDV